MIRLLACALLFAASPLSARSLTVRMGETWLFEVRNGNPVDARKAAADAVPTASQLKVSLRPMMGATLIMTNNSRFDYAYRATLILPSGKSDSSHACVVPANGRAAIENWNRPVAAVRIGYFRPAPAGSLCP